LQEKHSPPPNSAACRRTWISEPEAAPAAAAAAAGRKRQRKAYASLTGPPKGLPEKLGDGPLRLILVGCIIVTMSCYITELYNLI
jgi:hypothetical protein